MAVFRFKLDPVLEQRKREERETRRVVAELDRERVVLESEIRSAKSAMDTERAGLRDILAPGEPVHIGGARMQAGATLGQMTRAQRAVLKLAGVHQRMATAREALIKAAARRRAVESLRDRRLLQWKAEISRRESAEADDMTMARVGRPAPGAIGAGTIGPGTIENQTGRSGA